MSSATESYKLQGSVEGQRRNGVCVAFHSGTLYKQCDTSRLFLDRQDGFAIKVMEADATSSRNILIKDESGVSSYLKSAIVPLMRVIMIQQQSSWGPLAISVDSMDQILTELAVFQSCVDVVQAFGWKVSMKDESFTTLRLQTSTDGTIKESAYLAKYVEEHEREGIDERWSLRKSGIYHRTCAKLGNTFIIVNPSKSMQLRLKSLMANGTKLFPQDVHLAVHSAAMETWRWCTSDMEERSSQMKTKAHLTRMDGYDVRKGDGSSGIEFEDIQDIQVLQDKLEIFQHALDGNLHVLTQLPTSSTFRGLDGFVDLRNVASSEKSRIASVLRRLAATSDLVARILDFRCLASLDQNSRISTALIRVANEENALIVQLGKKASHDADVVRMLTLLALIFLPANFTATVMDMGYITVQGSPSSVHLEFAAEFYVFLILTAVFLVITLGAYFIWLRGRKSVWHRSTECWQRIFGGP